MKVISITLSLVVLIFLFATVEKITALTPSMQIAQHPHLTNEMLTNLVLFETVDIVLKDKTKKSLTGRLTLFDLKKQILEVSRNNISLLLSINQIQQIIFRENLIYCGNSRHRISRHRMRYRRYTCQNIYTKTSTSLTIHIPLYTSYSPSPFAINSENLKHKYHIEKIEFEPTGVMKIKLWRIKKNY